MAKKLEIDIIGNNRGLKRALTDSKKDTQSFGKDLGKMAKHAAEALAVFEGFKKVTEFLTDAAKAASAAEVSQARLNVTLKNSGATWKGAGKAVTEYLQKQSELSGFMRNDLSEAFANNERSTNSIRKSQQLLNIEMDVARTKNISLTAASSLLNRVYNGSYMGLKRLGIGFQKSTESVDKLKKAHDEAVAGGQKFTKQQMIDYKASLAAAKATDKLSDRQRALAMVKKKFSGQSAAYAKTEAGMIERLKAQYEELQIKIGSKLLPVVSKVAGFILKIAQAKSLSVGIKVAWSGIESMVKELKTQLFGGTENGKVHIPVHMALRQGRTTDTHEQVHGIVNDMSDALAKVQWGPVGEKIAAGISKTLAASDKIVNGLLAGIGRNKGKIADIGLVIGITMFNKLMDPSFWAAHWQLMLGLVLNIASVVFTPAKLAVVGERLALLGFKLFGKTAGKLIIAGLEKLPGLAGELAPKMASSIGRGIEWLGGKMVYWGVGLVTALLRGITRGFGKLGALISTLVSTAIVGLAGDAVTWGFNLGKQIAGGVVSGLGNLATRVANAVGFGKHLDPKTSPRYGKHADGGMIPGNYALGDIHPAMLSGGEAVLNPTQINLVGRDRVMSALQATGAPTGGGFYSRGRLPDRGLQGGAPDLKHDLLAKRDAAQANYNHLVKLVAADVSKETDDKTWLARNKADKYIGKGKKKTLNPLWTAWETKHKAYSDPKTGDAAIVSRDKGLRDAAKGVLSAARSKYSDALAKKLDIANSLPDPAGFAMAVNARNALLAQHSLENADADAAGPLSVPEQGDYDALIGLTNTRIGYLKGLLPKANATRRDAINQELASDYDAIKSYNAAKKADNTQSDGSGGSGSAVDQSAIDNQNAINDQNAVLAGYYRRGIALQGAADSVLGGGTNVTVNMNSLHPGSADVLSQIGTIVTSALDSQPSIGASRQSILV